MTNKNITIQKIDKENHLIYLDDGRVFEYLRFEKVVERFHHDGSADDYCDQYVLKETYDSIYVYKNKWAYYKELDFVSESDIFKLIEKRKQQERVGNKYKHLKKDDLFTLKEFFPIYKEITKVCDNSYIEFLEIFNKLGLDTNKKYPLYMWIEGSKMSTYVYNYLFTEYFEEEAN